MTIVLQLSGCGDADEEEANSGTLSSTQEVEGESIDPAGLTATEELPDPLDLEAFDEVERAGSSNGNRSSADFSEASPAEPEEPPLLPAYREQVSNELESSLLGDSSHAVNIGMVMVRCHGATLSEERVVRQLERMQKSDVKPGTRWTFANGMSVVYENYEQYESYLWQQHDQCQSVDGLFNKDLRTRLESMAEQGNVQARYLYAMWPPEQNAFSATTSLSTLDYHNRALDFTWANLDQGETLGLMAMGQSYSGPGRGLFTARDHSLGRSFLLAAELCGLENNWLQDHNTEIRNRLTPKHRNHLLTNFDRDATELAALFCK